MLDRMHTETKTKWPKLSCAFPRGKSDGMATVKFWKPGVLVNGAKSPEYRIVLPRPSSGAGQMLPAKEVQDFKPMAIETSLRGV